MGSDTPADREVREVWLGQPVERTELRPEELRRRARRMERRVSWRNVREYATAAVLVPVLGYGVVRFPPPLIRLGWVLLIAGTVFSMAALHRRGSARGIPEGLAPSACLDFHRAELRRQRDLLLGVWTWYLLPLVPGLLVLLVGFLVWALQQPGSSAHRGVILARLGIVALGQALLLVGVGELNRWAARRLQRQLDELERHA